MISSRLKIIEKLLPLRFVSKSILLMLMITFSKLSMKIICPSIQSSPAVGFNGCLDLISISVLPISSIVFPLDNSNIALAKRFVKESDFIVTF